MDLHLLKGRLHLLATIRAHATLLTFESDQGAAWYRRHWVHDRAWLPICVWTRVGESPTGHDGVLHHGALRHSAHPVPDLRWRALSIRMGDMLSLKYSTSA